MAGGLLWVRLIVGLFVGLLGGWLFPDLSGVLRLQWMFICDILLVFPMAF